MVSKEFFEFISSHCGNVVAWLLVLLPFFHLTFIIGRFICYLFREYKIVSQVIGHDSDTPLWMVAFELSCIYRRLRKLVQTGCSFVLYCFCAKPALSARHYHDAGCSLLKPVFFARPAACSCRSTAHCANVRSRYFRKGLTRQRCTQRLLRGVVGQAIRIRRKHHERRSKLFFLPGKSQ